MEVADRFTIGPNHALTGSSLAADGCSTGGSLERHDDGRRCAASLGACVPDGDECMRASFLTGTLHNPVANSMSQHVSRWRAGADDNLSCDTVESSASYKSWGREVLLLRFVERSPPSALDSLISTQPDGLAKAARRLL